MLYREIFAGGTQIHENTCIHCVGFLMLSCTVYNVTTGFRCLEQYKYITVFWDVKWCSLEMQTVLECTRGGT